MHRHVALCAALLLLGSCGSSSASSQAGDAPARCGPHDARTLAASSQARVYVAGGRVLGCSAQTGRRTLLGSAGVGPGVAHVGLVGVAGQYAAYELQSHGVDTGTATVVVRRLSDGSVRGTAPAVSAGLPESFSSVSALVVKDDGAAAWIGTVTSILSHGHNVEVHKLERGAALLDSGGAIGPRSLRLAGSKLTWRHGAMTRSATLR